MVQFYTIVWVPKGASRNPRDGLATHSTPNKTHQFTAHSDFDSPRPRRSHLGHLRLRPLFQGSFLFEGGWNFQPGSGLNQVWFGSAVVSWLKPDPGRRPWTNRFAHSAFWQFP